MLTYADHGSGGHGPRRRRLDAGAERVAGHHDPGGRGRGQEVGRVGSDFRFFFSSRRRHTRFDCDWSSDVCSSDLRFLSLTRYGQSRAVSEGVPMVLWIDTRRGAYGLQQQAGYTDGDSNAVRFVLSEDTRVEVQMPAMLMSASQVNQIVPGVGNVPLIRFSPDGFLGGNSPGRI